jgi:hypothetical protein
MLNGVVKTGLGNEVAAGNGGLLREGAHNLRQCNLSLGSWSFLLRNKTVAASGLYSALLCPGCHSLALQGNNQESSGQG